MTNRIWARFYAKISILKLMQVDDPIDEMPVVEVRDKYAILDGDKIVPDFSEPDFEAAQQASDEEWDMPSIRIGKRFCAIIIYIDSDTQEIWIRITPREHMAILVEPFSYIYNFEKGDEIIDMEMIGFRGSYLVCRGPSEMQQADEVPDNPTSYRCFIEQDQSSSSSKPHIPYLGVLRNNH